jgi:hypothetical protein
MRPRNMLLINRDKKAPYRVVKLTETIQGCKRLESNKRCVKLRKLHIVMRAQGNRLKEL